MGIFSFRKKGIDDFVTASLEDSIKILTSLKKISIDELRGNELRRLINYVFDRRCPKLLETMIAVIGEVNFVVDRHTGFTLLHKAVYDRVEEFIPILADNCANPNLSDLSGKRPIHYCGLYTLAMAGLTNFLDEPNPPSPRLFKLMLDNFSDIDLYAKDESGMSVFDYVVNIEPEVHERFLELVAAAR